MSVYHVFIAGDGEESRVYTTSNWLKMKYKVHFYKKYWPVVFVRKH